MLTIRLQRTGRHGHAQFRVVVQDSRQAPTSGKFVALLGSYNPHNKTAQLNKEQVELYLKNGAQPSDRVARLLHQENIKLPDWVEINTKKTGEIRNAEKLRRNRPAEQTQPKEQTAEAAGEPKTDEPAEASETNAEESTAEEAPEQDNVTEASEPAAEAKKPEPEPKDA
jgi:small subunit ribosomal protein S16